MVILWWMKDTAGVAELVHENVRIDAVLGNRLEGRKLLLDAVLAEEREVASLEFTQILSHGKEGAAHGVIRFSNGEQQHFADFYTFENNKKEARIQGITRYVIGSKTAK